MSVREQDVRELDAAPAVKSGEVRGYIDEPVARYVDGLRTITKADELREYLQQWPFLAADAIEQAARLTDADIQDFQKNRAKESEAQRITETYGAILMPGRMIALTILGMQFMVPTGCVYIRLWTTGEHDRYMEPTDSASREG